MSTAMTPPNDRRHDEPADRRDNEPADRRDNQPAALRESKPTAIRPDSREVVRAQKERFGGMKFGACFFGWLTAAGTGVLLTALLAAAGTAFALSKDITAGQVTGQSPVNAQTIGLVGAIVLAAIILISYLAGGYVAGRMARFNGLKQGLGVWIWAVIAAVVVAVLSAVAGSQFNVLGNLNGFPRIPVGEGNLTAVGIGTAVALALVALIGALLGGLAGMRFHRRVDRADLDLTD